MTKAPTPVKRKGTVWVNFRSNWFSPDGVLYEVTKNPHQVPAEWANPADAEKQKNSKYAVLPSSTELLSKEEEKAVEEAEESDDAK